MKTGQEEKRFYVLAADWIPQIYVDCFSDGGVTCVVPSVKCWI